MKKLCLIILDGYGIAHTFDGSDKRAFNGSLITSKDEGKYNIDSILLSKGEPFDAVATSTYYKFRELFKNNPYTLLNASSYFVGLPYGQMGNSEVGHLNIGAGQVVKQDLIRINDSINSGEFESVLSRVKIDDGANLHLIGLVSDGGVHSHINHLLAILHHYKGKNLNVFIHFISDGRDTDPKSGIIFAETLNDEIAKQNLNNVKVATLSGRYYAMDREKNLDRTQTYFDCIFSNAKSNKDILEVFDENYNNGITDEFIKPINLCSNSEIKENDTIILFNFRADRMRQITNMLSCVKINLYTMTSYNDEFKNVNVLFPPYVIKNNLSAIISHFGLKQLKVAEQSKYAHVTYFLNGGIEKANVGEDRILVPMASVATFDKAPEMSAKNVEKEVKNGMDKAYDFICVNFANCDMVGHTGVLEACKISVETVTKCAYELAKYAKEKDYIVVITADHGNAEIMQVDGRPHTAHTNNKVPFIVLNAGNNFNLKKDGSLCNIMPTILNLMELK